MVYRRETLDDILHQLNREEHQICYGDWEVFCYGSLICCVGVGCATLMEYTAFIWNYFNNWITLFVSKVLEATAVTYIHHRLNN